MPEIIEPPEWQRRDPYWQNILYQKWSQKWEREQAEYMMADEPEYKPQANDWQSDDYDDSFVAGPFYGGKEKR